VVTEETGEFDPNTVSAELLRGYRIGNRVIRHSMVKVATAPAINENVEHDGDVTEEELVEQGAGNDVQDPEQD